jgi:iron complex outermembrane receptor protein
VSARITGWNFRLFPAAGPGTDQIGTPLSVSDLKGNYTAVGQFNKINGESHLAVLDVEDKVGDVQLTSITGFNKYRRSARVDCDGGPVPFCNVFFGFKSTELSEEFRAYWETDRSRWTTGAYFLYQDGNIDYFAHQDVTGVILGVGPGFPVDSVFGATQYPAGTYPGGLSFDVIQNQKLYSISGFAHVEYDLTPKLTGILGVRLGYDDKKTDMVIRLYVPAIDPSGFLYNNSPLHNHPASPGSILSYFDFTNNNPAVGNLNKIGNVNVTSKAELDWHPKDNMMIYTSVKRGVKAAAFNNGFVAPSSVQAVPVKKEILWAYEGGFKGTMFDDRLRLNLSGFYYDYKDFQGVQFVSFGSYIGNYDATITGMETQLNAQVTDRLSLSLYAGYLDSQIKGVKPVQDLVQPAYRGITYNREMIFAPPWNIGGSARYEWPSFFGGTMAVMADFYAKDKFHVEIVNNPANDVPAFVEGNARIQYTDASKKYQVTFFVNNLANNIHIRRIQDQTNSGGYVTPFYAPGRWIGGSIRANFDL